jgi:hypothetical protein
MEQSSLLFIDENEEGSKYKLIVEKLLKYKLVVDTTFLEN